jgi:hypothetical protein
VTDETALPSWTRDEVAVLVTGLLFVVVASLPWFEAFVGVDKVAYRAWDLGISGVPAVVLALYAAVRTAWLKRRPLPPEVPLTPGVEPFAAAMLAFVLTTYRALDVPYVSGAERVERTIWLSVALCVVVLQAVCALRVVARTGLRA